MVSPWIGRSTLRRGGVSPPVSSCKNPKAERRGGYHPPATTAQPLRLVATGAFSPSSETDFSPIALPAAAARKRSQTAEPPAPGSRNDFREAFFVTGVRGRATGVLALLGASPRGSLVLSIIGKNTEGEIPPPRRRVPLPPAAKEPKRRFLRPLGRFVPSGGKNLGGFPPPSGPLGPGAAEVWALYFHWVRLVCAMLFGWVVNDLPRKDRAFSGPGLSSKLEEAKRSFAQSSFAHFSFKKSGCGKSGGKCVFFPEGVFFFEGICAILTEICVFLNRRSYIERHPLNHPVSQRQPQDL